MHARSQHRSNTQRGQGSDVESQKIEPGPTGRKKKTLQLWMGVGSQTDL